MDPESRCDLRFGCHSVPKQIILRRSLNVEDIREGLAAANVVLTGLGRTKSRVAVGVCSMRGRVFLFNITQPFAMKIDTLSITGLAACYRHVTRVWKALMYS